MTAKVLVYVPVMNEEKTVKAIVDEIYKKFPDWDVIVVDDVSEDNTIQEVQKTKARLIPLLINTKGSGGDLVAFMMASKEKFDYLLKIDGDGQQDVDTLGRLLDVLKKNKADIAVGSRYLKKQRETDSFIKVIGRTVTSSLINFKIRGKNRITDTTSGIRAWNSKSIQVLNEYYTQKDLVHDTMFWTRENIEASKFGLKIYEIPAFYKKREYGKSKSFSLRNMFFFPIRLLMILFY